MTPAEYYGEEHRNLLAASTLANKIRNEHPTDCPCHQDQAITEPIPQQEQE